MNAEPLFEREKIVTPKPHLPLREVDPENETVG
jgi:hypothetical protein